MKKSNQRAFFLLVFFIAMLFLFAIIDYTEKKKSAQKSPIPSQTITE